MARKENKALDPINEVLRDNLQRWLDEHYGPRRGQADRVHKKHPRIYVSRIQNLVETGKCNLATVGRVARELGLQPYQLLIPKLDSEKPQVALPAEEVQLLEDVKKRLGQPSGGK